MHRSESEELGVCAACGGSVSTDERTYTFGYDEVLCFSCAVGRGGSYDEPHDHWVVDPDVEDLLLRSVREG